MLLALLVSLLCIVILMIVWRMVQIENKIALMKREMWGMISDYHGNYHRDLIAQVKRMIADVNKIVSDKDSKNDNDRA